MFKLAVFSFLIPAAIPASFPVREAAAQLEVVQGFPLVRVYVNRQGPFRMLLDTGGQSCKLSPRAARKIGLEPDERVVLSTSVGEAIIPGVRSAEVTVGDLALDGVEILIANVEAIGQAGI